MENLTLKLEDNPANRIAIAAFGQAKAAAANGQLMQARKLLTDTVLDQIVEIGQKNRTAVSLLLEVGSILMQSTSFTEAERIYRLVLDMQDDLIAYSNLAFIMRKTQRIEQAEMAARKACECYPERVDTMINLINILLDRGNFPEFEEWVQKAITHNTEDPKGLSICLHQMHYFQQVDREAFLKAHQKCSLLCKPTDKKQTVSPNTVVTDRKLRIGYISSDFGAHAVSWFLMPILQSHDKNQFEVFGYCNRQKSDIITDQYIPLFDCYRKIHGWTTGQVCQLIENDAIDILIDLTGHTNGNSIPVLAQKPAPIQVTYLGYPDTTGLPQVDYRLTDRAAEATDAQDYYSEKLFYLENGFLCYGPPAPCPDVGPLPAQNNSFITFGSFNMNKKINPFVVQLWANVIKACDNSRLILKFRSASDPAIKAHYLKEFQKAGISEDRIEIYGWLRQQEHMNLYNRIDIALDTYPYHGTTTTCEAFYMGVPVISLIGKHHMSRVGLSLLTRIGLESFAVSSPDDYISKAAELAAKPESLAEIRASMRARMTAGTLCDKDYFTRTVEQAYRTMWQQWCQEQTSEMLKTSGV